MTYIHAILNWFRCELIIILAWLLQVEPELIVPQIVQGDAVHEYQRAQRAKEIRDRRMKILTALEYSQEMTILPTVNALNSRVEIVSTCPACFCKRGEAHKDGCAMFYLISTEGLREV